VLDTGDQAWLNRHLIDTAFRQATGHACFRRLNSALDGILVSDVGKRIEVRGNQRAGGLIPTAIRATDIIWDRVWQLETDNFEDMPGFVFAASTDVVDPAEDPTAPHPEIQRQAVGIRTDFDRFSTLEIRSLVQHGYCVGRKVCRAHPDLFKADSIDCGAPWDPIPEPRATASPSSMGTQGRRPIAAHNVATTEARALQASAGRRIWSTLLDRRDWTSYVYVPLLIPILLIVPYLLFTSHQRSQRNNHLIESLAQGSPDREQMSRLLDGRQVPWRGAPAEEVRSFEESDNQGFGILQDSLIFDLRGWQPVEPKEGASGSEVFVYRRLKVLKQPQKTGAALFHVDLAATSPQTAVRFPTQQLEPKLSVSRLDSALPEQKECHWRASYDFKYVPPGEFVDLIVEYHSPGRFLKHGSNGTTIRGPVRADTAELTA
jgi:hypothetical protein